MTLAMNPSSIVAPMGPYSQAMLTPGSGHWLHIAGQIGVRPDGELADGVEAQTEAVWSNIVALLAAAGMTVDHLVKINSYLVDPAHVPTFGAVRARFLGDARPASTLVVVAALARPQWLVEVEAVAWKA
jgi:2-iminobutanoate/2-iminopropanoate deaminase